MRPGRGYPPALEAPLPGRSQVRKPAVPLTSCVDLGESLGLPMFQLASKWAGGPYLREDPARSKIWKFFTGDI